MKVRLVKHLFALLAASLGILAATGVGLAPSHAADFTVGKIGIDQPWARATAPGQRAGGGFLVLRNGGADDRLLEARAAVSQAVELHTMVMENNTMRMRRVEGIDLPAGGTVALQPGGLHVMFIGLNAPLKEGDRFPLTLRFEKAGEVTVDMAVMSMTHGGGMQGGGHGAGHGGMKR